jgi:hypothetical protein
MAMFTKDELEQLGQVIDTRLDAKLDEKLAPLKKDIKLLKRYTRSIKETVDVLAKQHDKELMHQRKQLTRVGTELHLSPLEEDVSPSSL